MHLHNFPRPAHPTHVFLRKRKKGVAGLGEFRHVPAASSAFCSHGSQHWLSHMGRTSTLIALAETGKRELTYSVSAMVADSSSGRFSIPCSKSESRWLSCRSLLKPSSRRFLFCASSLRGGLQVRLSDHVRSQTLALR